MDLTSLIIGATIGAYVTFIKTRKERLLADQYEVLRDIITNIDLINTYFEDSLIDDRMASALGETIREKLRNETPDARHELGRNIAKLRLLFKDNQITKLTALYSELNTHFFYLHQCGGDEIDKDLAIENMKHITEKATQITEEVISVAQTYCLSSLPVWLSLLVRRVSSI